MYALCVSSTIVHDQVGKTQRCRMTQRPRCLGITSLLAESWLRTIPSKGAPHNAGLTQYVCDRMKPLLSYVAVTFRYTSGQNLKVLYIINRGGQLIDFSVWYPIVRHVYLLQPTCIKILQHFDSSTKLCLRPIATSNVELCLQVHVAHNPLSWGLIIFHLCFFIHQDSFLYRETHIHVFYLLLPFFKYSMKIPKKNLTQFHVYSLSEERLNLPGQWPNQICFLTKL